MFVIKMKIKFRFTHTLFNFGSSCCYSANSHLHFDVLNRVVTQNPRPMKERACLALFFQLAIFTSVSAHSPSIITLDTLPDGRFLYDLSRDELELFSGPHTMTVVFSLDQDIKLSIGERLYLLGTMLTAASPTLRPLMATRALPGLTRAETGIAKSAKELWNAQAFKKGITAMRSGQSSEATIDGVKIVFQADGPFSGLTLFGENGFVIGKEALRSQDEIMKTVLHECYRLSTSAARSNSGVSQVLITQETNNVVNFVERAFKSIRQ